MIFDRTLAIAHRGASTAVPENTVAAIVAAGRLGADAVTVDVQTTRDGVAVLHQDRTLARRWQREEAIPDLAFERLRGHVPEIPTLDEALVAASARRLPLILDVASVPAAKAAAQAVEARRTMLAAGSVWFCGHHQALAWLRASGTPLPRMLSWKQWTTPVARLLAAVAPSVVNPWHRLLSPDAIRFWHEAGLRVCTWTLDEPGRRRRLLDWGVDAVISTDVAGAVADVAGARAVRNVLLPE
jgi:glycerophosphoryl diester phosphodiesterase